MSESIEKKYNCKRYESRVKKFYLRKNSEIKIILEIIFQQEKDNGWNLIDIKKEETENTEEIFYELFLEKITNQFI